MTTEQTSKIQKLLADATEVEVSKRKNETGITDPNYLTRLMKGITDLPDKDWDKLAETETGLAAQDWFNAAIDAIDAKQPIPPFPDLDPPAAKESASSGRRRGGASAAAEPAAPRDPAEGDKVEVITTKGRTYTGTITTLDDEGLVLELEDGGEKELDKSSLKSVKVLEAAGGDAPTAEPEPEAEPVNNNPEVGDTIEHTSKRGKVTVGKITELTDSEVVLELTTGEVEDFRLEGATIVVKVKGTPAKPASGRRGAAAKETAADKKEEPADKKEGGSRKGASEATVKIRQLVVDDLAANKETITKRMKDTGLEFNPATLNLIFSDVHKTVDLLRAAGLMKK